MLVVGSINVDLVVSVARLPAPGETVIGGQFARHAGGKGANQAVAATRLGARVTFIGAVGDDEFGRDALDDLMREQIDIGLVRTLPGTSTGVALIVVDERGENQIAVASGANGRIDRAFVRSALDGVELAAGGCLLTNLELPDDAVVEAARSASRLGLRVVVNPAPARPLPVELLRMRPMLIPNELEAQSLTGEHDPVAAARSLAVTTDAPVIVTLGAVGAVLVEGRDARDVTHVPAPAVAAVDATGAGDAFAGALAAQLAAGAGLVDATRVAVRAASLSVTARGARDGMPTRAELDRGEVDRTSRR